MTDLISKGKNIAQIIHDGRTIHVKYDRSINLSYYSSRPDNKGKRHYFLITPSEYVIYMGLL